MRTAAPGPTTKWPRHLAAGVLPMIVVAYIVTLMVIPADGFWINDNGCKFIQMKGLILNGYRDLSIPWPGRDLDPDYVCNPLPPPFGTLFRGKLFGFYSHPFALLSSFPYRLLGARGLSAIALVSAVFLLLAVRSMADRLPGRPRTLAMVIVGLCTPVWFYSVEFWEHLPACCLVTWSVASILAYYARPTSRASARGALFLGLAIYFRDNLYLFALPLMVVVTMEKPLRVRRLLLFGSVLAVTLAPLWAFNWVQFGHPLGLRLVSAVSAGGGWMRHLADRPAVFSGLLLNGHKNIALSLLATLPFVVLFFIPFRIRAPRRDAAMVILALVGLGSGIIVLSGHLHTDAPIWWLIASNGLFAASPVLILGLVRSTNHGGGPLEPHTTARLIRLIMVSYVGIYMLASPLTNTAGIHWGCRLLLPVYPLLGVLAASGISRWRAGTTHRTRATAFIVALIALSLVMQVYSQKLRYERKSFSAALNQLVAQRHEHVVAALGWFIPQEIATVFYDKKIFLVRNEDQLMRLLTYVHDHGVQEVFVISAMPPRMVTSPETALVSDGVNFISLYLTPLRP